MGLSEEERTCLHYGSLLHDIGNIGIPDAILLKPTGLSNWKLQEIKLHPIIGEQIYKPLASLNSLVPLIRSHHEKLDSSGYLDGLRGEEIPLLVRILSVSDVYHTLRSERAFRPAYLHDEALDILQQEVVHGWWDSEVVHHLTSLPSPEPLRMD